MSEKRTFVMSHAEARRRAMAAVADAPEGYAVTVSPPSRNTAQNSALWAKLSEVSEQVDWHGQKLTSGEWKDVFTSALKRQKVVPGLEGGFVVLGSSTSKMSKAEMSELLELISAFAAEHEVDFAV